MWDCSSNFISAPMPFFWHVGEHRLQVGVVLAQGRDVSATSAGCELGGCSTFHKQPWHKSAQSLHADPTTAATRLVGRKQEARQQSKAQQLAQ